MRQVGVLGWSWVAWHLVATAPAQEDRNRPSPPQRSESQRSEPLGLVHSSPAACDGYTLFTPLQGTTTFLLDMDGEVVHTWASEETPGQSEYLLDNGHLVRCVRVRDNPVFRGGGQGGKVLEMDWDGQVVWEFEYSSDEFLHHHDLTILPNGNVLLIAWERKNHAQALLAGRDSRALRGGEFWPDCLVEIEKDGRDGGRVVWEWHLWDHLIQDRNDELDHFGIVAEHPERVDINADVDVEGRSEDERSLSGDVVAQLRRLGYLSDGPPDGDGESSRTSDEEERSGDRVELDDRDRPRPEPGRAERGGRVGRGADWTHVNGIDYDEERQLICFTSRTLSEVFIIDHSTSTEEAAGSEGGRQGRGGDILYRWGNPANYDVGDETSQQLFGPHDPRFLPNGHLLLFNNGIGAPGGKPSSSVLEIAPERDDEGRLILEPGFSAGPEAPVWSYSDPEHFYSSFISGAHRLPNGNTLICSGAQARIFEVTMDGDVVWDFHSPIRGTRGARGGPPRMREPDRANPRERDRRGGPGRVGMDRAMFRATRLPADHPAFEGRTLTPIDWEGGR